MGRTGRSSSFLVALAAAAGVAIALSRERAPAVADGRAAAGRRRPHASSPGAAGRRDRGERADRPGEIPARGWRDILRRTARQVTRNRLLAEAAGATFYSLLAVFPALAALVSLYGLVADPATIEEHLSLLAGVLPGGGMEIFKEQLHRLAGQDNEKLGFGAILGLAVSIWSARQGVTALCDALNIIYEEEDERSFFHRVALTLAFTAGGLLFALLALAAVVVVPVALKFVGFGDGAEWLISLLRWPLLLAGVGIFLACLYRYGPSREDAKWRWVSWGSGFAALAWLIASAGFSWYVANFGSYNETYGSLGAAIGFMTWIWISASVVLVGAQLDAEMERQTERDTTTGPEKPRGMRGARMADAPAAS